MGFKTEMKLLLIVVVLAPRLAHTAKPSNVALTEHAWRVTLLPAPALLCGQEIVAPLLPLILVLLSTVALTALAAMALVCALEATVDQSAVLLLLLLALMELRIKMKSTLTVAVRNALLVPPIPGSLPAGLHAP